MYVLTLRLVALITHCILMRRRVWARFVGMRLLWLWFFERRLKTLFLIETSPNQTQFLSTGAVVDFSSVAPVSKNRPRCEHSSSEIATFGHDPGSDAETGPEEVREVLQTAPKSSYVRNEPAAKKKWRFRVRLSHFSDKNLHKLISFYRFWWRRVFDDRRKRNAPFFKITAPVDKVQNPRACRQKLAPVRAKVCVSLEFWVWEVRFRCACEVNGTLAPPARPPIHSNRLQTTLL